MRVFLHETVTLSLYLGSCNFVSSFETGSHHHVAQARLKLRILLLQPLEYWDYTGMGRGDHIPDNLDSSNPALHPPKTCKGKV